ncbi:hypothetical protein ACRALDRAFT_1094951 [Sodiomyces alcalophilus JCM 7366]|uniref:uncharacterized protein n=1 Tax=Sodiomyces alcalophilus JCM 7366 TaxID=591952 RepID=UPI0039B608B6
MRPRGLPRAGHVQVATFHSSRLLLMPRRGASRSGRIALSPWKPRQPAPTPPSWKPFAASNLLLDLDAYESKHVRPYNETDEARHKDKWATNPTRDALKRAAYEFNPVFKTAHSKFDKLTGDQSSRKWRVSDLDLMTAAIMGLPTDENARPATESPNPHTPDANADPLPRRALRVVLRQNAIPTTASRDDERLLDWLLHRQSQIAPKTYPDAASLQERLGPQGKGVHWQDFFRWRRLVVSAMETESGLVALGASTKQLAEAMALMTGSEDRLELIGFMHNLRVRLANAGLELGPHLCGLGLVLSAHACEMEAMRRYLNIGLAAGYWGVQAHAELEPWSDEFLNGLPAVLVVDKDGLVNRNSHGRLVAYEGGREAIYPTALAKILHELSPLSLTLMRHSRLTEVWPPEIELPRHHETR